MLDNNSNTQFVVMTMSDYMNMVHEAARNLVAVQSATSPSTTEMEDKYMTRQEVAKSLKASLTSLWRWNKEGILIFPNDEVVAIKTIIDQYAENKEARISVGNWLAMFAESEGKLNDDESERAYSEVEDIATGKYDHRLGRGGQSISM